MAAVGGDIIEITWNHPTLGSGVVLPKSAEDSTIDPGGLRTSDDANMVDGAGNAIMQMNRVRWSFETVVAWDAEGETLNQMAALAASNVPATWTFESVNGSTWKGYGKPVGDLQGNGNQATFTLKVSGGGVLKKIS